MNELSDTDFEPMSWLLIFHVSTHKPWLDRLLPGRFKHVSALGYVEAAKCWLVVDVALSRMAVKVAAHRAGDTLAARIMAGNGVLRVKVRHETSRLVGGRFGFWCVPAMKHLVGADTGALRPDTLWRDLVASGAEIVADVQRPKPLVHAHA
jgi:hypothetical protein